MAKQYGFYFNVDRCVCCHTCEIACKATRNVELGITWRKVIEIWAGEFPNVSRTFVSLSCLHCAKPACKQSCSTGAISKRAEDGIVVIDREKCNGCRECFTACPYQIPQFGADGTMQKCDFCLEKGIKPACVAPCPTEALFYGSLEQLNRLAVEKSARKLAGITGPSIFIANVGEASIPAENLMVG